MSEVSELNEADAAKAQQRKVVIPYVPRKHFRPLHQSTKRWKFVVAHRRAGKSVAEINEMIRQALINPRQYPPPRYAYVGPSFAQTKDLIWGYAKHYTSVLPGVEVKEGDLQITLPNGAMINLYGGAAAYERMRGLYFDGIVLDEFPMLNPSVFSTVVRPCLADYRGWAIISGTSNGDDHFHELKKKNYKDDSWDFFIIPVNETGALHPDEVVEMTKDMTPEEYAREMLCSFDAPIEGSYYGNLMNDAALQGRVTKVPYDPSVGVITWWDLGIDDAMAVWFVQIVGKSVQIIRYQEYNGKGLDYVAKDIKTFGYDFQAHVFPHDVSAREIGTGRTRLSVAQTYLDNCIVCPKVAVEDGINAVKTVIPMCYFDEVLTADGISAMKNYHRTKKGQPDHNWASHGADAFRYGSVSFNMVTGFVSSNVVNIGGRLHRKIRGVR